MESDHEDKNPSVDKEMKLLQNSPSSEIFKSPLPTRRMNPDVSIY